MSYPHPIENIMRSTMEQLKEMLDVNTIVGDPMVAVDGTMIIPISKVSTGFSTLKWNKMASTRRITRRWPLCGNGGACLVLT